MNRHAGDIALITGVSSGLGYGFAKTYLGKEWGVYGLSRREPEELAGNPLFHFQSIDLAAAESIQEKMSVLMSDVKAMRLIILNAGILGEFGDMGQVPLPVMKKVMDVNVWANKVLLDFVFSRGVVVQQVVAISSGASVSGSRGWNAYGISKAALNMMIKLYSQDFPQTHFCSLAPAVIDSGMQEYLCSLDVGDDYPTIGVLKSKKDTPQMPQPLDAAETIVPIIDKLPSVSESGSYVDIREMGV